MAKNEIFLDFCDLNITVPAILEYMGCKDIDVNDQIYQSTFEMLGKVSEVVKPRFYYEIKDGCLDSKSLTINDCKFGVGPIISKQLKNSVQFALFVATAGNEYHVFSEKIKATGDPFDEFILDSIGTLIAENTADCMEVYLQNSINALEYLHTNRYSPGYCGWNVSEQQNFFSLLPTNVCGIKLSDSSLMIPIKSVSGVIGIGKDVQKLDYTCIMCGMKNCARSKISNTG